MDGIEEEGEAVPRRLKAFYTCHMWLLVHENENTIFLLKQQMRNTNKNVITLSRSRRFGALKGKV